ncbi:hypothetical protein ACPOL_6647 [Acidisarcina polymorpha]|uniref:Uncharacterized protein n=1 Tax=Acidisarcina polymorpha TaxID=2211140 RepID=A0A2Z5GA07_9BACT|nr:hypothetical protein ACPOL_6647 [Acidisarcina polymorpha]
MFHSALRRGFCEFGGRSFSVFQLKRIGFTCVAFQNAAKGEKI